MNKRTLIESILRILKGGDPRSTTNIMEGDVERSVARSINKLLKVEAISMTTPYGTTIPVHTMMATYPGIETVDVTGCDFCEAELPAVPIALPMNMGIFRVTSANCPGGFIVPLEPGMMPMAQGIENTAMSAMLGTELIAYEPSGGKIRINRKSSEVPTVDITLLISDISQYGEYDRLPIPADMESDIVRMALQELGAAPMHDESSDGNDQER